MHGTTQKHSLDMNMIRCLAPGGFRGQDHVPSVLLNYDVKIENDGGCASEWWFEVASLPDPTAKVKCNLFLAGGAHGNELDVQCLLET